MNIVDILMIIEELWIYVVELWLWTSISVADTSCN